MAGHPGQRVTCPPQHWFCKEEQWRQGDDLGPEPWLTGLAGDIVGERVCSLLSKLRGRSLGKLEGEANLLKVSVLAKC